MPISRKPQNGGNDAAPSSPLSREATHVAPVGLLAEAAVEIALAVEREVLNDGKRADQVLSILLRRRRDLAIPDQRFVSSVAFALFRWRGWIEPLGLERVEARLLYASLLDSRHIHPVCRFWARQLGLDGSRLFPLGDAPNWPARSEGFRRLVDMPAVTADPWRLFPPWLREHLPLPPGGASPKTRFVELLEALQTPAPLWVRATGADPEAVWNEMRAVGVKPWVHRKRLNAAKLEADVDVYHLPSFSRGAFEIQDLASQAVGLVCDPDPGDRWWDACSGAGGKALQLSALMNGKGLVLATDVHENKLKEAVRRARRSPYRNLSTKRWDGRYVPGKPASFDGVLVDAPCSAMGTWRRNPDARWSLDRQAIPRLAELQGRILAAASAGVRGGGALVYSVCTLTVPETIDVVRAFLESHPQFQLDPFPHPLTGSATDGTLQIWPKESDTDAMFVARFVRIAGPSKKKVKEVGSKETQSGAGERSDNQEGSAGPSESA
jgi:16S rRNA (cytosine967-C5)-methyltransferase